MPAAPPFEIAVSYRDEANRKEWREDSIFLTESGPLAPARKSTEMACVLSLLAKY